MCQMHCPQVVACTPHQHQHSSHNPYLWQSSKYYWKDTLETHGRVSRSWDLVEGQERNMAQLERMERRRAETMRRGLRMVLGKVRRKKLHFLPPVRLVVLFFILIVIFFLWFKCVSKKIKKITWKEVWKFWKKTPKSMLKLGINKNKWTEYTKKLVKKIPVGKCMEAGDKYNSMIRTIGKDWTWWDMWYGNQIPSW